MRETSRQRADKVRVRPHKAAVARDHLRMSPEMHKRANLPSSLPLAGGASKWAFPRPPARARWRLTCVPQDCTAGSAHHPLTISLV